MQRPNYKTLSGTAARVAATVQHSGRQKDLAPANQNQNFVFILAQDFTHMAFSCAIDPLRIANLVSGWELNSWSFASGDGEFATSSNGSVTLVHHGFDGIPKCDFLFVLSVTDVRDHTTAKLLAMLRRERAKGR